ncbi:histone [Halarchaeum nitratireducens]|uniref:Aldolase n=1 Tax=Halarchaeum nitratireducens TaxID=489913 RepID=A0A830G9R0_9EURY|nr:MULTISPECIES: histone [Halarchaeum]MBP2250388.1 histone H3/H4 [Halarchaeum solikamskense]GGN13159.1 aldolase [Halarchaeum nitratireducens]
MSVELPFAPVDTVIRREAGDLRVSADAAEELARRIQRRGAALAREAAEHATDAGRKTLMVEDFGFAAEAPERDDLTLPVAPVDRIARLDIPDEYRVAADARVALAAHLEAFADDAAEGAATLARHAGRRTVQAEDVETYFELVG